MSLLESFQQQLAAHRQLAYAINKQIAYDPELSGEEYHACAAYVKACQELGLSVEAPFNGQDTAFRAVVRRVEKPVCRVALLAEYDALPDIGHGCGHSANGAMSLLAAAAFHFMDGANVAVEYTYDANGNLKKDYNKKIVNIAYNSLNLPDGLQFTNGNTTSYVYDAAGEKLSVTHQTAIAGVVIPMTSVMTPLAPAQISTTFKTDYCGNVIYENGVVSRILT